MALAIALAIQQLTSPPIAAERYQASSGALIYLFHFSLAAVGLVFYGLGAFLHAPPETAPTFADTAPHPSSAHRSDPRVDQAGPTSAKTVPPPSSKSLFHFCATGSWIAFLCFLASNLAVSRGVLRDLLALSIICAGFLMGVVALFGIRSYGTARILWPSLVGLILNGLFLLVFVTNYLNAVERARSSRTSPWSSPSRRDPAGRWASPNPGMQRTRFARR